MSVSPNMAQCFLGLPYVCAIFYNKCDEILNSHLDHINFSLVPGMLVVVQICHQLARQTCI